MLKINLKQIIMKKTILFSLVAFLIILGCSKSDDSPVTQNENQSPTVRTATPIATSADPAFDNNIVVLGTDLLRTNLQPVANPYNSNGYPAPAGYDPSKYDVMCHFKYFSPVKVDNAVVEFTFSNILNFVPHVTNDSEKRNYAVNYSNNQTFISCFADLTAASLVAPTVANPSGQVGSPMFCFIVKVDCSKGINGLTTFWTDMKVNGKSVKGTIKDKIFACK